MWILSSLVYRGGRHKTDEFCPEVTTWILHEYFHAEFHPGTGLICKWDNTLTNLQFFLQCTLAWSIMSTAINNHIQYNTDVQMLSINWWYCYVCPRGVWGQPSEEGGLPAPWVQQCRWKVWEHLYSSLSLSESHSHCRYRRGKKCKNRVFLLKH